MAVRVSVAMSIPRVVRVPTVTAPHCVVVMGVIVVVGVGRHRQEGF